MRSQIFFFLGLFMFVVLIFGVTLISQYATTDVSTTKTTKPTDGPVILGSPLLFSTTEALYRPEDESITKRYFQAFHEVRNQEVRVPFWFKNPYPVPVAVAVRGRSCTSCTTAYLTVLPADAMQHYLVANALAGLPASPLLGFTPVGLLQQIILCEQQAERNVLDFDRPNQELIVPAAVSEQTPTWGLFEMVVRVSGLGPKNVATLVTMQVGNRAPVPQEFRVNLVGVPPFEIEPKKINLGDMVDGSAPRSFVVNCFSATRDQTDFPTPFVTVNVQDAFVEVGTPIPMTYEDRNKLFYDRLANASAMRILSGYQVPITVYRRNPKPDANSPNQPDIGPFERQISFGGIGDTIQQLTLTGTVVGQVSLVDGNAIDLKDFNSRTGTEKVVELVSDRADLELEVFKAECLPSYLGSASLAAPRIERGRKYWSLKIIVPKDAQTSDLPRNATVTLLGKSGDETIKVRLPVRGRAFARGQ